MPTVHSTRWHIHHAIAWTGAAVFVASLLWFVYSYVRRFDAAQSESPVIVPLTQNVLMFSLFALHHSAFARTSAKQWLRARVPAVLERSLYTWIASLLFIALCTWWRPVPGVLYSFSGPAVAAAFVVQAVGGLLAIKAAARLDVLELAGVRAVLDVRHTTEPRHIALQTDGLYALVRHPVYLGWVLFVFGSPDMTATRAVFSVVSTSYLAMAIPWEERTLIEAFGSEYERYRARVRWKMVPGMY